MEKKQPLVSIGLPTCNNARYLREALESLLGQTHRNFELIISDNASTDGTKTLCEEYARKEPRIRYLRHKENIGQIRNFALVFGEARGDYFMWAADDDLRDTRFIEKCLAVFKANHSLSLVMSRFVRFDEKNGTKITYDPRGYLPLEKDLYERLKRYLLMYLSEGKAVPIYGLWDLKKIHGVPIEEYISFDVVFIFRNLSRGAFGLVDEPLFMKRADYSTPVTRRSFPSRVLHAIAYRLQWVLSPFYPAIARHILTLRELSAKDKAQLMAINFWTMCRLFLTKKM